MSTLSTMLSQAGKNIKKAGKAGDWVEAGLKGGLALGTVGGAAEWSQGGSFTEGFKDASFEGAALGLGARAVKVGAYGKKWKGQSMSNSVKTLRKNAQNSAVTNQVLKGGNPLRHLDGLTKSRLNSPSVTNISQNFTFPTGI